jgi:regulatory protein
MNLLARREHSCHELTRKLAARGFDEVVVAEVVGRLSGENLVSDERFAEALYRSRIERGYGPARIAAELRDRGVDPGLVEQWVDFADTDWLTRGRAVLSRKFGAGVPGDARERARQMRFLHARGFTQAQIRRLVSDDELE